MRQKLKNLRTPKTYPHYNKKELPIGGIEIYKGQKTKALKMIDPKLLIARPSECAQKLAQKAIPKEDVLAAVRLIKEKNQNIERLQRLRSEKNQLSRSIKKLPPEKRKSQAEQVKGRALQIKENTAKEEASLALLEEKLSQQLLNLPNFPADEAPKGASSAHNVEIAKGGLWPKESPIPPHWEIMEDLNIFDQQRAGKIAGSMFAVLKGSGAKLLRALTSFAFDLFEREGYQEFIVPSFVNTASFTGTGQLPKFAHESYHIEKDDLWAIPTGEVPLTALHRNEILKAEDLPLKYMACTPCFRREAGAAGHETRGLQRLHEFHKVELVKICQPDDSPQQLQSLLESALKPIKLLNLPYRVLDLCAGDLTFSSARTYDIEVWSPGAKAWLEVSSVGLFTDYQSRRSRIRFKKEGKIFYPHTLNGSGLATPRVIAGLLENGYEGKGKVKLPTALIPYMGSEYL